MSRIARSLQKIYERWRLRGDSFVLVSNNCWGYELYHSVGREYNTPFVGLFLHPDCYIKLVENFDFYLSSQLEFIEHSKYESCSGAYPIGLLAGDVEIHFLHYPTKALALDKWRRRVERLNAAKRAGEPFYFKLCDRDGCTEQHLRRFHAGSFGKRISMSVHETRMANHLCLPELKDPSGNFVVDGLRLYRSRYGYFDISSWISTGDVRQSLASRLLGWLP